MPVSYTTVYTYTRTVDQWTRIILCWLTHTHTSARPTAALSEYVIVAPSGQDRPNGALDGVGDLRDLVVRVEDELEGGGRGHLRRRNRLSGRSLAAYRGSHSSKVNCVCFAWIGTTISVLLKISWWLLAE